MLPQQSIPTSPPMYVTVVQGKRQMEVSMFIVNFVIFNFNANFPTSQAVVLASIKVVKDTDASSTTPSYFASNVCDGGAREEAGGG